MYSSVLICTAVSMDGCMHLQLTSHTAGRERTHAVLVLPSGLRLLRVVTEWFASLRSVGRAACGGASPICVMLIYVLCGDVACGGGPHEVCAVCDGCMELYAADDGCMGEPCIQAGATTVAHSMPPGLVVVFFTAIGRFMNATLPPGIVAGRFMRAARPPGAMSTVHLASFAATALGMVTKTNATTATEISGTAISLRASVANHGGVVMISQRWR